MDPLTPPTIVRFRRRWYRVLLMTVLMIIPFGAVKTDSPLFGIPPGQWLVLALGMLAVWAVVVWSSWRCPACGRMPGDHWRPQYCEHCGVPLLYARGRSSQGMPRLASQEEWRREESEWYRQVELAWAGRRSVGLIVVAIGVFFFGIIAGIGGETRREGLAGLGFAGLLALFGWLLVRWIRQGFEAAGLPPERVELGVRGMLAVAGMVMIFLGIGGLLYVVSPFDPTPINWELRLEPLTHAKAMAFACGAYILGGMFLVARGLQALRGNRC